MLNGVSPLGEMLALFRSQVSSVVRKTSTTTPRKLSILDSRWIQVWKRANAPMPPPLAPICPQDNDDVDRAAPASQCSSHAPVPLPFQSRYMCVIPFFGARPCMTTCGQVYFVPHRTLICEQVRRVSFQRARVECPVGTVLIASLSSCSL